MTNATVNRLLQEGLKIEICPWQVWSNQCLVQVKSIAGDAASRTVTYTWEGGDGEPIEKTAQVSETAWNYIFQTAKAAIS